MNYRNIKNVNKRQFEETLRKEGFSVYDYYTNTEYKMFFRRMDHSDSTVTKMRAYFSQDTPINRGSVLVFKGETFVVINKDGLESEIYYTAILSRCNVSIGVNGRIVPCVMSTPNLTTSGSFIRQIASNVTLFTGDCALVRNISVNNEFIIGGRAWAVQNSLYIDGLYYILLEMTTASQDYDVSWDGAFQLDMNNGTTVQNQFHAKRGNAIDPDAVLTYSSSDTSVATIAADGTITLLTTGSVTFTATWSAHNVSESATISVVNTSGNPDAQYTCEVTVPIYQGEQFTQTIGGSALEYTCMFYDYNHNEAEFQSGGTWSIYIKRPSTNTYTDAYNSYITAVENDNKLSVTVPRNSQTSLLSGGIIKVGYTAPSGVSGSVEVEMDLF